MANLSIKEAFGKTITATKNYVDSHIEENSVDVERIAGDAIADIPDDRATDEEVAMILNEVFGGAN